MTTTAVDETNEQMPNGHMRSRLIILVAVIVATVVAVAVVTVVQ